MRLEAAGRGLMWRNRGSKRPHSLYVSERVVRRRRTRLGEDWGMGLRLRSTRSPPTPLHNRSQGKSKPEPISVR